MTMAMTGLRQAQGNPPATGDWWIPLTKGQ